MQVYALRPDRQRAVATETLQVWCSLAERLGMFALKVISLVVRVFVNVGSAHVDRFCAMFACIAHH